MTDRPPAPGFGAALCRGLLGLFGWKAVTGDPVPRRGVIVAAPHTSNWDAVVMLFAAKALGVRIRWVVKEEWSKGPLGWLILRLGGLPIRRTGGLGMTDLLAKAFEDADDLLLAIAPSGTRKLREHWRSGFYHLARAAQVPFVCGVVDWGGKRAGLGAVFDPSDDPVADMARFREAYAGVVARFPDQQTPIRLKDEG